MLDYEWGNPSTIMICGDEPTTDSDQTRQMFDHYTQVFNETQINPNGFAPNPPHFHQIHPHTQTQTHSSHFHSLYDPPAFNGSYPTPSPVMLSLESFGGSSSGSAGFMVMPKSEPGSAVVDFTTRIGLDLGGRTYFSSEDDDFVNRLYRRSRMVHPGSFNSPRCQAEGCNADLTHAKHYHRRHKVCEFHSKAAAVIAAGLTQRFCQQCSRFHLLSEFDNGKRSCRKRLADHNRRRRKSSQQTNQEQPNKPQLENAQSPPSDSGAHSSSSVTIAISPPRMRSSLFFSNG